jgi:high-affinity Fe2+/Pb2+ permease
MELGSSHGYAIFTVVAITVVREGIESVIFLAGGLCVEMLWM